MTCGCQKEFSNTIFEQLQAACISSRPRHRYFSSIDNTHIPEITNAMLLSTLKELEGKGIVSRTKFNEVPLRVEYSLTKAGQEMMPIFSEMGRWGMSYLK